MPEFTPRSMRTRAHARKPLGVLSPNVAPKGAQGQIQERKRGQNEGLGATEGAKTSAWEASRPWCLALLTVEASIRPLKHQRS